jgi:CheY-like chemotaxis protein
MSAQVMVVDDHADIRDIVSQIFSVLGYDVHAAQDGMACLQAAREGFKGVIILDLMMPGMDGWEVLEHLKKEGHLERTRVLVLSALDAPEKHEGLQMIQGYFNKPFDLKMLRSAVENAHRHLQG